ncbi:MAG: PIN domain-containing protein [Solirubrobacterales bacterium]|nr:PIN domain-containing protein [Solirubrobacterales bacterium]MBV9049369.1 PIN domain-containing protein [Solirubrobacterales bacterium]
MLRASRDGLFELVVSEVLLVELKRAVAYPKRRKRIPPEKAAAFANWARDHASLANDPEGRPPVISRDSDDNYFLALAISRRAYLVTGDQLARRKRRPPDPRASTVRDHAPFRPGKQLLQSRSIS